MVKKKVSRKKKETPLSILKQIRDILIKACGHIDKKPIEVKDRERFIKLSDGWIRDIQTGLEWGPSSTSHMNWKEAKTYCEKAGGRFPTVRELESLIDRKKYDPAVDKTIFTDTKSEWYWTCEEVAWSSSSAWCVSFNYGYVGYGNKGNGNYVRPVRSSQ